MNRLIYSFLLLSCAASALVSCTADPTQDLQPSASEGETWVTLDFGDNSFDEINITTRTTLNGAAEGRVANLFVFLFNASGERVYGRMFDRTNRVDTEAELKGTEAENWWVDGNSQTDHTQGKVRMHAPAITNGSLYILANVSADMVNISPEKLRFIETLDDLKAMTATLNQKITERNGFFPMTGSVSDIKVGDGEITSSVENSFPVKLTRIDAKIEVKVRVAAGYEGISEDGKTTHKIKEFVPLSWQVVNLPRAAYVLPREADAECEFFNSREIKFETRKPETFTYTYDEKGSPVSKEVTSDIHGFSFYMLENRFAAKQPIDPNANIPNEGKGYHARETRLKDDKGAYVPDTNGTGDIWKYAPAEATYLIIKGEVVMDLTPTGEKDQQLSANVVYYVHLGDFASSNDDYNVERNTSYTYTITIYGVDKIQAEVEKQTEDESGATGHVYVAKESILTFDAHYGCAVVAFDAAHLTDLDKLSWYVSTPFGREGTPNVIGGIEVPSGLDYQWVHFIVNEYDEEKREYKKGHAKYKSENAKNILDFSKYIKEQKRLLDNGEKTDFKPEHDDEWGGDRYRIYVTIFVDEFYYDKDPVTGDARQDLWKDFVNQPDRMLHILCDSNVSKDGDSRSSGSVVTIRQRSIQTIFNTEKPELQTAWGCETIDETRDDLWFYSRKESYDEKGYWVKPADVSDIPSNDGNYSQGNGLFNTARIWGLMTSAGNFDDSNKKSWENFIDLDRKFGLRDGDDTEILRYSCMTRNRDENGNGEIDAAEVKWYMASITQLASLYVGDQGLDSDAALYPYYKQNFTKENEWDDEKNVHKWRVHIVSSTACNDHYPEIMWAEEGLSTGSYRETHTKSAGLSVRCVRNLGMDPTSEADAQDMLRNENRMPEKAIQVSGTELNGNTIYTFNMENMNPLSIRYYTSRELEPNNEFSMEARVYWGFETGPMTTETYTYDELYDLLMEGKSPCPVGYRVPNAREGALVTLRCPPDWQKDNSRVSTYYSHGSKPYGSGLDIYNGCRSWFFNSDRTRLDEERTRVGIRCVKDIRQ